MKIKAFSGGQGMTRDDVFTQGTGEIQKEWDAYYNETAYARFGATYGYIEKTPETRNFLYAYQCVRKYITKYDVPHTELRNEDMDRLIWESRFASGLTRMRPQRPFLYEQTGKIVVVAALLKEVNDLLHTTATLQDIGLGYTMPVLCPHCNTPAQLTDKSAVRPGQKGKIYLCKRCGAYCGTHGYTDIPLGHPGNELERKYRGVAHRLFDIFWKGKGMTREQAYGWLSGNMGIYKKDCHIGRFGVGKCKQLLGLIGLPPDLEVADYWNMVNTNRIPWKETVCETSIKSVRASAKAEKKPTHTSERMAESMEKIDVSSLTRPAAVQEGSCIWYHKKAEAALGNRAISDLIKYICDDLDARHMLKNALIGFIAEYHYLNNGFGKEHAGSIGEQLNAAYTAASKPCGDR